MSKDVETKELSRWKVIGFVGWCIQERAVYARSKRSARIRAAYNGMWLVLRTIREW